MKQPTPAILYKDRPIVGRMPTFKDFLRQANREGRKTQTRRVILPQPEPGPTGEIVVPEGRHGSKGDVRVMCEPLIKVGDCAHYFDTPEVPVISLITGRLIKWRWSKPLLTSIHMPTEAGRFVVEYTGIRAEWLDDISDEDCIAEGVVRIRPACHVIRGFDYDLAGLCHTAARTPYAKLWEFINGDRPGCTWEDNPIVRVISYRQI